MRGLPPLALAPPTTLLLLLLLLLLPPVHTGTPVLGQQGPTVHGSVVQEKHSQPRWRCLLYLLCFSLVRPWNLS